ncbi:tRNA-dihydrouridine synthase [Bacteroidia bacterium]|nr:tRNA-dihydrouridine synthase [Bacteroidia bacterium]
MNIGNLTFDDYPVFLAPMEDVTDIGFRLLCKEFGADMVYTEFISSDALIRHINKTQSKLEVSDEERPVAIQIYGKDVAAMVEAARICETAHPDVIDLNFGCPVKKVAGKGAGSGMLRTPEKLLEITAAVVRAVNVPVTVKTRLGWDHDNQIIVDLAEKLQDCGIAALTIHGRTRAQMYTGEADWTLIGAVKNNPHIHIPIIGNGDITSPETAKQAFDRYGVDAVMIGRGSIGAPWIFQEVKNYLNDGNMPEKQSFVYYLDVLKRQICQSVKRLDERRGILHSRRHIAASPLFKGIPDFKPTRVAMLRANTMEELFGIMNQIAHKYEKLTSN